MLCSPILCGTCRGMGSEEAPLGCWKSLWMLIFLTVGPALEAAVGDGPDRDTTGLVTVGNVEAVGGLGVAEMRPKVLTCF